MVRIPLRNLIQSIHPQSPDSYTPVHPYEYASDALAELRHFLRSASASSAQVDVQELVELAPDGSDGRVFAKLGEGRTEIQLHWAPRTVIKVSGLLLTVSPDFGVVLDGAPHSVHLTERDLSATPGLLVLWLLGLQLTGCPGVIVDVSRGRMYRLRSATDLPEEFEKLFERVELLTA